MESSRTIDGERWQKKENSRKITKKQEKQCLKGKFCITLYVIYIRMSFERGAWSVERGAWSVERGAWSVMEAATESPHTEKGAQGDAKEQ